MEILLLDGLFEGGKASALKNMNSKIMPVDHPERTWFSGNSMGSPLFSVGTDHVEMEPLAEMLAEE